MINAYAVFNDDILQELAHPSYIYGKNGYVFFNMHNNIEYGEYHKCFADMVLKVQNYCEDRGVKFYLIFDPEKISVYRRYLPVGVNYDDSWVDEMFQYMDELGIHCVNNTDLLMEKNQTEQVFNVQYDAGHWNDLGSFYATNALLNRIHQDIPEVHELSKEQFEIKNFEAKYLPVSKFKISENVPSFKLKSSWTNITKDYQDEIETHKNFKHFHYFINDAPNSSTLPKILFFQGSYYNRGPQFLISQTSEYIGVHNYQNVLNIDYYFNIFKPDVVIFDVAEYVLNSGYFDFNKMNTLNLNPCLLNLTNVKSTTAKDSVVANLISGKKVDTVIINNNLPYIQYAYLIVGEEYYDFQNKGGILHVSIPHGTITDNTCCMLYTVDRSNNCVMYQIRFQNANNLIHNLILSNGVSIDKNQIVMTTNLKENRINEINLQIYDALSGNYISTINSGSYGKVKDFYYHNLETGLYKIRLKSNSTLFDEYVEFVTQFNNGESYLYEFDVKSVKKKQAKIDNFKFIGHNREKTLKSELKLSQGTTIEENGLIKMNTRIEDNNFHAVHLQLLNGENNEYICQMSQDYYNGSVFGTYVHQLETGNYIVRLKANSNLQDECVDMTVKLEQGYTYYFTWNTKVFEKKNVCIDGYDFFIYTNE